MSLYDITVKNKQNEDVSMKKYEGKVLLIVNTATGCGFTPQYKGLQTLYERYKDQGFEVLDFPCNQFANQAPEDVGAIDNFCTLNYQTTFPRFAKVDVNGKEESTLFTHLKQAKKGLLGSSVKWNFTKFLVDREGNVIKRYAPKDTPESFEDAIKDLL